MVEFFIKDKLSLLVYLSQALFPAEVVPFPMEEGKTVSYTVDSWAEKRYAISLKTEYRNEAAIN